VLDNGERQVAPDVSGIRRDHVARYEFALTRLKRRSQVIDLACGVGYGSHLMASAGHQVIGIDRDADAVQFARKHYGKSGAIFRLGDASTARLLQSNAAVCFETIEHLADPLPMLRNLRKAAGTLIASVPNETVFPFRNYKFHHRHYTRAQFQELLAVAGWRVTEWHGQAGPHSEVEPEIEGRTLVVVAKRARPVAAKEKPAVEARLAPDHVVIIGLGPSASSYMDLIKTLGNRRAFADEVWAINAMADIIQCDRVFHMDDLRVQEARAAAQPDGNIAAMIQWMRKHPGPIYTSVKREGYPGLVEFPLADVIGNGGIPYFNSTAAYAIAYAIHIGVKEISFYGIDYTLPNAHSAEQGRACCEFWIGMAMARGILINVPAETSLMDGCEPTERKYYGYDHYNVLLTDKLGGGVNVELQPKEKPPTAQEIEARYNHRQHPNPLMRKK
jgi:SAM-dependent methyltransferase